MRSFPSIFIPLDIPTPYPHILALIPCILTLIFCIPTLIPQPDSPDSPDSLHAFPRFPIPAFTVKHISDKLTSPRTYYECEKRKVESSKRSGAGNGYLPFSKWRLFD